MRLSQIIEEANALADEQESSQKVAGFINDAIAKINIKLKANFPYLDYTLDPEPAFPEAWQRVLLIPFAVGRIKQMDSSQFEYTDAYAEFLQGLENMAVQYRVPELYKDYEAMGYEFDPVTGQYKEVTSDIYTTPPVPWGWRW